MTRLKEIMGERPAFGMFVKLNSIEIVEMIALSGFDFIIIDMEHSPFSFSEVRNITAAAQGYGLKTIIRTGNMSRTEIQYSLDIGADGVQIPQIYSARDVKIIAKAGKYPPIGERGVAFSHRAARYGFIDTEDYIRESNSDILIGVHVETKNALEDIENIAVTEGLDLLFVGPTDLSYSLETDSNFIDGGLASAFNRIHKAAKDNNKLLGVIINDEKKLEFCLSRGTRYIVWDTDLGLFKKQLIETRKIINKYI